MSEPAVLDAPRVAEAVTSVTPDARRPGAVRIEVAGRLLWTVAREVAERERLAVGMVPTAEAVARLEAATDREAALRTGLRALSRRPFAARDLVRRMVRKGHPRPAAEAAVAALADMGLVDDRAFADQYVELKARRGQGPRRLMADLRALGVEAAEAQGAIDRAFPPDHDLGPMVDALVAKRAAQLGPLPAPVKRRRLMAYLARRGFGGAQVLESVNAAVAGP